MLKAKAIERFLSQVLDESAGITGVMLFNKEGWFPTPPVNLTSAV